MCIKHWEEVLVSLSNKKILKEIVACQERVQHERVYYYVFDGSVWNGMEWFLSNMIHFGFMLHRDWFCPYRHVKYISIVVIYLVCLNLPRS